MAAVYSFASRWEIAACPERCWAQLEGMLRPGAVSWWRGVTVEGAPGPVGVGTELALSVRSPLGYRLRVRLVLTALAPGFSIAAASEGDLRGSGRMEIAESPGGSILTWYWHVVTARGWMNATARVLRPAFEAAHARVMRQGEAGLRAAVTRG